MLRQRLISRIDPERFQARRNVYRFSLKAAFLAFAIGCLLDTIAVLGVLSLDGELELGPAGILLTIGGAGAIAALSAGILALVLGLVIRDLGRSKARFQQLSRVDALSGLLNRRAFNELIERDHGAASLAILDLDRFKAINDTHGHLAGDKVIRSTAALIDEVFPEPNIAARLGGEEFAVLISGSDSALRRERVERIRQRIADQVIRFGDAEISVSVSVGLADFDERDSLEVYSAADRALYLAKAAGRDRVVHETELAWSLGMTVVDEPVWSAPPIAEGARQAAG